MSTVIRFRLFRRAATLCFLPSEINAVARAMAAFSDCPVDVWRGFLTTNVRPGRGLPPRTCATCLHAMATAAVPATDAVRLLLDSALPNANKLGFEETSWLCFAASAYQEKLSSDDRCKLVQATERALGTIGQHETPRRQSLLAIIYAAANLHLQGEHLYSKLALACRSIKFTPDEAARIAVRFAMSTVSEMCEPVLRVVLSSLTISDLSKYSGAQVAGLLHGISRCGILDNGFDLLLISLQEQAGRTCAQMDVKCLAFCLAAMARTRGNKQLGIIITLWKQLMQRVESEGKWSGLPAGMLPSLVPAAALLDGVDKTLAAPFWAYVLSTEHSLSSKIIWSIRKNILLTKGKDSFEARRLEERISGKDRDVMSQNADVEPASPEKNNKASSSSNAGSAYMRDLSERLVEKIFQRDDKAVARVIAELRRRRGEWHTLPFVSLSLMAFGISRANFAGSASDLSLLLATVARRADGNLIGDARSIARCIEAMGRVNFRNSELSTKLARCMKASDVSQLAPITRCSVLGALANCRHYDLALETQLIGGYLTAPETMKMLPPMSLAELLDGMTLGAERILVRRALENSSPDTVVSFRVTVRVLSSLLRKGGMHPGIDRWSARTVRLGHDANVSASDLRPLCFLWPVAARAIQSTDRAELRDFLRINLAKFIRQHMERETSPFQAWLLLGSASAVAVDYRAILPLFKMVQHRVIPAHASVHACVTLSYLISQCAPPERSEIIDAARSICRSLLDEKHLMCITQCADDIAMIGCSLVKLVTDQHEKYSTSTIVELRDLYWVLIAALTTARSTQPFPLTLVGVKLLARVLISMHINDTSLSAVQALITLLVERCLEHRNMLSPLDAGDVLVALYVTDSMDLGSAAMLVSTVLLPLLPACSAGEMEGVLDKEMLRVSINSEATLSEEFLSAGFVQIACRGVQMALNRSASKRHGTSSIFFD